MSQGRKHILGLILVAVLLSGCATLRRMPAGRVLTVCMLLAKGGLGDRSFNDSAYAGLQLAQQKYNARFQTADWVSDEANLEALRGFTRQDCDLLLGIGFENARVIAAAAKEYPQGHFAIIDTTAEGDNVASIVYREQEGDFLMGVLAAMLTKTGKVGFIGGADIPAIRRIESGFRQGLAYQNPQVELVSELAGTFADPDLGQQIALKQYAAGVDLIYNGAGRTGLGIIEAARTTGQLTLGTSGDQRYLAPGNVVGNRPKRVDTAVLTLVQELRQGQFQPGVRSLGLKERGLSLGPFDPAIVTDEMIARITDLERDIVQGRIQITVE